MQRQFMHDEMEVVKLQTEVLQKQLQEAERKTEDTKMKSNETIQELQRTLDNLLAGSNANTATSNVAGGIEVNGFKPSPASSSINDLNSSFATVPTLSSTRSLSTANNSTLESRIAFLESQLDKVTKSRDEIHDRLTAERDC